MCNISYVDRRDLSMLDFFVLKGSMRGIVSLWRGFVPAREAGDRVIRLEMCCILGYIAGACGASIQADYSAVIRN